MKSGKLFIISAPSGAGKTTLVNKVLERIGHIYNVERLVTYTTKSPRTGEIPGKDYHYISIQEFEMKVTEGFFLEVTRGLGHYYGTPRTVIDGLAQGRSHILIIDIEGARQICTQVTDAVLIWIQVKNIEILRMRLTNRGSDSEEQIQRRLDRAQLEIDHEKQSKMYKHHVLNDDFATAVQLLEEIISRELKVISK